ncbi:hypothetical protein G6F31_015430 [Rhizopus arrhizus]|nr:hypothetical protein G6F31_015430 [Rhizopus arrhizus]
MPQAFADDRARVVFRAYQRKHGDIPGTAVSVAGQVLRQQRVIGQIGFLSALHLGVAGRIDPGRTSHGRHAQAGSVSQGGQPGQAAGMARLGQGVFDEGDVRLFGLGHAQLALGHQFDAQGSEQGGKLAQLASIIGRQHDAAQGIGNLGGSHKPNCIGHGLPAPRHDRLSTCAPATPPTHFVVNISDLVTDRI